MKIIFADDISRQFFKYKNIHRYRMKKVSDMTADEANRYCHWFCEENNLNGEFDEFISKIKTEHYYCSFLHGYIEQGCCYDMQMIAEGFVKETVLSEIQIDKTNLAECCSACCNSL